MTSANEIIRVRAGSLRALSNALTTAAQDGRVRDLRGALMYVENWAAAVESMVLTEQNVTAEDWPDLKLETEHDRCVICGGVHRPY